MFEPIKKKALLTKDDYFHLYYHKNGIQCERFYKVVKKPIYKGYVNAVFDETIVFSCYECDKKNISKSIVSKDDRTNIKSMNTYKLVPKTNKIVYVYLTYYEPYTIIADTFNIIENI
jgi:hypothetical protein